MNKFPSQSISTRNWAGPRERNLPAGELVAELGMPDAVVVTKDLSTRPGRIDITMPGNEDVASKLSYDLDNIVVHGLSKINEEQKYQVDALEKTLVDRFQGEHHLLTLKFSDTIHKQFQDIINMQGKFETLLTLRRFANRRAGTPHDERAVSAALRRRRDGLTEELADMLRRGPDGLRFLRRLLQSEQPSMVRQALQISRHFGRIELQDAIYRVADNSSMPAPLREIADSLLLPHNRWAETWKPPGPGFGEPAITDY